MKMINRFNVSSEMKLKMRILKYLKPVSPLFLTDMSLFCIDFTLRCSVSNLLATRCRAVQSQKYERKQCMYDKQSRTWLYLR